MTTKNRKLRWRAYLAAMAAIVVVIIGDACRKIDYKRDQKMGIVVNRTEKFFSVPANTDARVKAIADRIKRQNDTFHFVEDLSKRIGFPVWNKTLIASNSTQSRNNTDSSGITFLYIPFDNDSVIVATLIVRTDEDDTTCKVLNDFDYSQYSFDSTTGSTWNARDVFTIFTALEKSVFARTDFVITDKRLFPGDTSKSCIVHVKDQASGQRAEVLSNTTLCEWIDVCYGPTEEEWCDGGCTTGCEFYTHTEMGCTIVWYESGGGGGGAPSGGGSTWWPPACGVGGVNCGTTGWGPLPYSPLTDYTTQGYHHFEHMAYIKADKDAINDWKLNNIDTTGLDSCLRKILDKLLDTSNLIGKMLVKMDRASFRGPVIRKLKLKFLVATPTPDTSVNGQTTTGYYNPSTGELLDTIRINPTYLAKATELSMTRTLIHEITHAYLKLIFHTYLYNFSASQINTLSLDTLFNHYIDTLKALHTRAGVTAWSSGNPQFDHNFMANKMLSHFAAVLEKIDQSRLANKRYYWFVSWGGLAKTDIWKHYWPNYPASPASGAVSHDSITEGFRYALTAQRLDSMSSAIWHEQQGDSLALGLKKSPTGCYLPPF